MSTTPPEAVAAEDWIGVAEVAAEQRLTEKDAWDLVRRLGVPRTDPNRMHSARFRRSDFAGRLDASLAVAPVPRYALARGGEDELGLILVLDRERNEVIASSGELALPALAEMVRRANAWTAEVPS